MALSSINVTYSSQIAYDTQGVSLSTSVGHIFLSKTCISSITNNTSSISIIFQNNPINFTITASANYLITNIYNGLTSNSSQEQGYDSDSDSDSDSGSDNNN